MPNSKYPQQLDTSVEIPPVRNNILEVGSDAINSLRSAIFNIERALGINPQGAVGQTVSARLDNSLDGNGNIRPEALSRANVLSGPILDVDVSNVAAIKESKLKLDYPTTLLQDEISIVNTSISALILQAEELAAELSAHINPNAINRHKALAISLEGKTSTAQDVASVDLQSGSVQAAFEEIYNGHLNYSGINISADNNSHVASQVFFDNTNVSSIIGSDDVQEAIEDLALSGLNSVISHQDLMHSNGLLRIASLERPGDVGFGETFASDVSISFPVSASSSSYATVTVLDTIALGDFNLTKSDIVTITDSSSETASYLGSYEIESFTLSGDDISTITLFANFTAPSTSQTVCKISKNIKQSTNFASLLTAAREEAILTSSRTVQVCNPNSVRVSSSGIRPMEVTTVNRFITVSIDSGTASTIDLYSGLVTRQTLDSIVSRINEQCSEEAHSFLAYRADQEDGISELVIAYNVPDEDGEEHTITIGAGSDNGIDAAGFSYIEDAPIPSDFGSIYYIEGQPKEGLNRKIDSTEMNFSSSSIIVSSGASGINFLSSGIKEKDILVITNSSNPLDDGSYVIESITSSQLTLGSSQLPSGFTGNSQDDTRFRVYSNIASFENIIFDTVSSTFGAIVADIFLDREQNVNIDKRFEYQVELFGVESLVNLVDFEGDVLDLGFNLVVSESTSYISLSLDGGDVVDVRGDDNYVWLSSGTYNARLKFHIPSISAVVSRVISDGSDLSMQFFGFPGVNTDSNLIISRVSFNNYEGRVGGAVNVARVLPKLYRGNIGISDLSSEVRFGIIEKTIDELRSNGIIRGLEITGAGTDSGLFTFDLSSGICYVSGKRIVIDSSSIITDIDSGVIDKVFIAIDKEGVIHVEGAIGISCESPFEPSEFCIIGSLEYNGTSVINIDLRLFISDLDLKLLNAITVSPQHGMGHFSDIGDALKYAKRFSALFPKAGTPTVHLKSGVFNKTTEIDVSGMTFAAWQAQSSSIRNIELANKLIEEGLVIDFPVRITGEGESTELVLRNKFIYSDVTNTYKGRFLIPGSGYLDHTLPMDKIESGIVHISNLKMNNSRIILADMNLFDSLAAPLHFTVEFDNLTFDHQNFATTNSIDDVFKFRSISLSQVSDTITEKGNLSVNNCKFILDDLQKNGSVIHIDDPALSKSLSFTNNRLINSDNTTSLFSLDIVTFTYADIGANITILGNMSTSNFDPLNSNRATIAAGLAYWSDRIGRNVLVGGTGSFEGNLSAVDASFSGTATAASYAYQSPITIDKTITFENNLAPGAGDTSGLVVELSSISISSQRYRTLLFEDASVGSEFAVIRLPLNTGEALNTLGIQYAVDGGTTLGAYDLSIFSRDEFGLKTTELASTTSGAGVAGTISGTGFVALGFPDIVCQRYYTYWLILKRNNSTGFDNHVFSVRTTSTISSVDNGLGAA